MTDPEPSSTLATLTSRLLLTLGDKEANRFTSEITDEAWKLALAEYSYAVPNIITQPFTVTQAGRDQTLPIEAEPEGVPVFPGLLAITAVFYPWVSDAVEPNPLQRFYFYFTDGQPVVYIGGPRVPSVGEKLLVTYAATNTVDGLNEATSCTVPPQDYELLLLGAAGHAARLRTSIYNESFSNHPELKAFSVETLAEFRATLRMRRRQSSRQPLPAVGFKLDQWDGNS